MVPSNMALLLALFPAILMALAIVREKELGSITNLYVTPVTPASNSCSASSFPISAVAMVEFHAAVADGAVRLRRAAEGKLSGAAASALLIYVTATTGYGMLISAFTRTQIAALFGTAILTVLPATQFSGMLTPVSSLSGLPQIMGRGFPDDLFPADQRRHLHQGAGLCRLEPGLAGAGRLRSGPDPR